MKRTKPRADGKSAAATLRRLIRSGCVAMPGVFNAATARLVERAGFDAVYISGAGLANATAGVPDIGLLTLTEVAQLAGYIARAVNIPAIADADTGFGGHLSAARTVVEFEQAGLAGLHFEDQVFPKRCGHLAGKEIVPIDEMTGKLKAAVRARHNKDFLIIARTDARSVDGFDKAVDRANAYLEAGADAIFPEALETAWEFREFAKRVDAPLLANMTEFGQTPLFSTQELASAGVAMALYPLSAFRAMNKAAENVFTAIRRDGHQRNVVDTMQTRDELYDRIGYHAFESKLDELYGR